MLILHTPECAYTLADQTPPFCFLAFLCISLPSNHRPSLSYGATSWWSLYCHRSLCFDYYDAMPIIREDKEKVNSSTLTGF